MQSKSSDEKSQADSDPNSIEEIKAREYQNPFEIENEIIAEDVQLGERYIAKDSICIFNGLMFDLVNNKL